ncbi:MAG: lysophospholipid acyltransferase family protein [Bacteroidales bacterium]|nr:lysophospholipid acyltransferase family protein [Bacteroidales bacterium]
MYRLLAWLILAPLYVLSLLPLRVHYLFARIITWLLRDVFRYRRDVIDTNLEGAFPDMTPQAREKLKNDYYRHLGDVVAETVWAMTRSGRHISRKGFYRVDPSSEEVINRAYLNSPGVVTLLAHTGNWELASDLTSYMQHPAFAPKDMTVTYQTLHSKLSEQLFLVLRHHRLNTPGALVPSHKILRYMLQRRDSRRLYFFIADQYPYSGGALTTEFLGLQTEWHGGAEAIARKLHLPVLYVYLDKVKRGEYVIKISQICSDASKTAPGEVTGTYAALLERDILCRKESWLWSHRRWKNLWPYNCNKEGKTL